MIKIISYYCTFCLSVSSPSAQRIDSSSRIVLVFVRISVAAVDRNLWIASQALLSCHTSTQSDYERSSRPRSMCSTHFTIEDAHCGFQYLDNLASLHVNVSLCLCAWNCFYSSSLCGTMPMSDAIILLCKKSTFLGVCLPGVSPAGPS